jgi:uncharacterized paraquat-inducible protein A
MADDVVRDPYAPNPAYQRLLSVREVYETPQVFVCTACRVSELVNVQPRCPRCLTLMTRTDTTT